MDDKVGVARGGFSANLPSTIPKIPNIVDYAPLHCIFDFFIKGNFKYQFPKKEISSEKAAQLKLVNSHCISVNSLNLWKIGIEGYTVRWFQSRSSLVNLINFENSKEGHLSWAA